MTYLMRVLQTEHLYMNTSRCTDITWSLQLDNVSYDKINKKNLMGQPGVIVNRKTSNFQSFSSHFFSFSQSTNSNWSIYIPLHSLHLISFPIVFTSEVFMPPLIQRYAVKTPYMPSLHTEKKLSAAITWTSSKRKIVCFILAKHALHGTHFLKTI